MHVLPNDMSHLDQKCSHILQYRANHRSNMQYSNYLFMILLFFPQLLWSYQNHSNRPKVKTKIQQSPFQFNTLIIEHLRVC